MKSQPKPDALESFLEKPKPTPPELLTGLAQAYAIEGFRKYLAYQMRLAIVDAAASTTELHGEKRAMMQAIQRILEAAKGAYNDYLKLEQLKHRKDQP